MPINKIDTHPFFLRVLEQFRNTDQLPDPFFESTEEAGARVAVALAKRHYDATREADIIRCVDIVLGVCSLALRDLSNGDLCGAKRILLEQDVVRLFQHGWTLVYKLAKEEVELGVTMRKEHADTARELEHMRTERERVLLEQFAVTNGSLTWHGCREYYRRRHELYEAQNAANFLLWLERTYYRMRDDVELASRPDTLCASLALGDTPHAPLSMLEVERFFKKLNNNPADCERTIQTRLARLKCNIPKEWRNEWEQIERRFFARTLPTLRDYLHEGDMERAHRHVHEYAFFLTP